MAVVMSESKCSARDMNLTGAGGLRIGLTVSGHFDLPPRDTLPAPYAVIEVLKYADAGDKGIITRLYLKSI